MAAAARATPVEPECRVPPGKQDNGVRFFTAATPDSREGGAVSGVTLAAVYCGTNHDFRRSVSDHADIVEPPGVAVNTQVPREYYVGELRARMVRASNMKLVGPIVARIYVDPNWSSCAQDAGDMVGGNVPGSIVACRRAISSDPAYDYVTWGIWFTRSPDGSRYTLTIGPGEGISQDFGITKIISLAFCAHARPPNGQSGCGSASDPWVQRNGYASRDGCPYYNGMYSMTVTNRGGWRTQPAYSCVVWRTFEPIPGGKLGEVMPLGDCGLVSNTCRRR